MAGAEDEVDALLADIREVDIEEPNFDDKENYEEHEVWEV